MTITEFIRLVQAEPAQGTRLGRYTHRLGPPVANRDLVRLRNTRAVPEDLLGVVEKVNGIHLWANQETGTSYFGISPAEAWVPAGVAMYGSLDAIPLPTTWLAISYDVDGASFIVLDTEDGAYYLMDSCGPDKTTQIAHDAASLLDWIWHHRRCPGAE